LFDILPWLFSLKAVIIMQQQTGIFLITPFPLSAINVKINMTTYIFFYSFPSPGKVMAIVFPWIGKAAKENVKEESAYMCMEGMWQQVAGHPLHHWIGLP
jgi:hypothetical protein